ncbi:MAG: helix-turn-helix transcriptional regulator [Oscillospiraceae bacterium]|nr:helix-turn-helix transcriptional regulator [Oscillospiraceae bacterium]MBQ6902148.1 helix-turn-helix transcriptional regulator [Oscillospiraceae bacterium]
MNYDVDFKKIGNRIQHYRQQRNLTQSQLAEIIDTNQKHLSRIEAGYHKSGFDTILAITDALKIPVDALIADYDNSEDESNLKLILDDIRGMTPKQLNMLRENIETIKKYK